MGVEELLLIPKVIGLPELTSVTIVCTEVGGWLLIGKVLVVLPLSDTSGSLVPDLLRGRLICTIEPRILSGVIGQDAIGGFADRVPASRRSSNNRCLARECRCKVSLGCTLFVNGR